ncbi:hypothetical protein GQ42DRAFT_35080 [Ramicandelaber brevisporus]|nr:hypothetical protein GQ42DRAFT_35080 [Ramicandelaber brevisporus]
MTGVKYIIITDPHHPERSATAATAATLSSSASAALGLGAFGALGGVAGSSGYSSASAGTGSGGNAAVDFLMRRIVELYADYAMKNPFHTPEMPLRSELFDNALSRLLETK